VIDVLRLSGGLGNQLFQVSRALQLRASPGIHRVLLDVGWYLPAEQKGNRPLLLTDQVSGFKTVKLPQLVWTPRLGITVNEYSPDTWLARTSPTLGFRLHRGYWQSRKIVQNVMKDMYPILLRLQGPYQCPESASDYVAVHARLGDYQSGNHADRYGVTDFHDQIVLAESLAEELGLKRIVVFSDSPEIIQNDFFSHARVEVAPDMGAIHALAGMSCASGLVMSNSSLSWWAAAYGDCLQPDGRRVYMPHPWLRTESGFDNALFDSKWTLYQRKILG